MFNDCLNKDSPHSKRNPHFDIWIFLVYVYMILQFLAIAWGHDMGKQPVNVALGRLHGFFSIHFSAGQILVSGPHGTFYRLSPYFIFDFSQNTRLTTVCKIVIMFHS